MPIKFSNYKNLSAGPAVLYVISALVLVFVIGFLFTAGTYAADALIEFNFDRDYKQTLPVTGEGKAMATPDEKLLSFRAQTDVYSSASLASSRAASSSARIIEEIKKLGVEEANIELSNLETYPHYGNTYESENQVTGYEGQASFEVRLAAASADSLVPQILDITEKLGLTLQSQDVESSSSNREDAAQKARLQAIEDAKAKAKVLEQSLGITLGKIVEWGEANEDPDYYDGQVRGGNEVVVQVTLGFEIE